MKFSIPFFCVLSFFFAFFPLCAFSSERESSAPYISGDTFRFFCDHTYDELEDKVRPFHVKDGDTVFVNADYLGSFFRKIHIRIRASYILVTHNSDGHIPGSFAKYLDDPKILAWLGQNVDYPNHPKLHPIPIGVANRCWPHGNIDMIYEAERRAPSLSKKYLLYMNFNKSTFPSERNEVYNLFQNESYCTIFSPKNYSYYLADLAKSKFVLSPRGNGLDCHRTWEALLMGAIPIVRTSPLDPMYENLPVLIVEKWEDINKEMLEEKYREFTAKMPLMQMEKIYADYWLSYINSFRP